MAKPLTWPGSAYFDDHSDALLPRRRQRRRRPLPRLEPEPLDPPREDGEEHTIPNARMADAGSDEATKPGGPKALGLTNEITDVEGELIFSEEATTEREVLGPMDLPEPPPLPPLMALDDALAALTPTDKDYHFTPGEESYRAEVIDVPLPSGGARALPTEEMERVGFDEEATTNPGTWGWIGAALILFMLLAGGVGAYLLHHMGLR
jgi:hypothetical protein